LKSAVLLLATELLLCAEYQGQAVMELSAGDWCKWFFDSVIMSAQYKSQIPKLSRIWLRRRVMKSLKILLQNSAIALHTYIEYKPS
jgi:hypothetical protein